MELKELAAQYEQQFRILRAAIKTLSPLLARSAGREQLALERRRKHYYKMALECKNTAAYLRRYANGREAARGCP